MLIPDDEAIFVKDSDKAATANMRLFQILHHSRMLIT